MVNMNEKIQNIKNEIGKVIKGKEEVIDTVLAAMLAEGHILLEDVPGVGKTTLALTLSRVLGLGYRRIQFTPDTVPSDITGFTMYDKESGSFRYEKGAAFCNLLLADEINRTSSKTQSALLEVMEEKQVTVDGKTHSLPHPFFVIATQNPEGGAGTQRLPHAQLDRFLVKLSMGYPDAESEIAMLSERQQENPLASIHAIRRKEEILSMQEAVRNIHASEELLGYITALCRASRESADIALGISPRGTLALLRMTKASAFLSGRDYAMPEDVAKVFTRTCAHRIRLSAKARTEEKDEEAVLQMLFSQVKIPGAI